MSGYTKATMRLPPEWIEFFGCLNRHSVEFVVVGAYALAANGLPRASQDIDIFVAPTQENARRISRALADFGYQALAEAATEAFALPPRMATLGVPPMRIDIMNAIDGVSFEQASTGALHALLDEEDVRFLGLAELVANKEATGRTKDRLDVELLKEAGLWPPSQL